MELDKAHGQLTSVKDELSRANTSAANARAEVQDLLRQKEEDAATIHSLKKELLEKQTAYQELLITTEKTKQHVTTLNGRL